MRTPKITQVRHRASADMQALADLLVGAVRVTRGGKSVRLPNPLVALLSEAVHAILRGEPIAVISTEKKITTQQAADLLGMSRQHLVRLLDTGRVNLKRSKVGAHRRVSLKDVMHLRDENALVEARAQAIATAFNAEYARSMAKTRRRRS